MKTNLVYAENLSRTLENENWFLEKRSLGERWKFLIGTNISKSLILGVILAPKEGSLSERMFLNELCLKNGRPAGIYSNLEISNWCKENEIRFLEGLPESAGDYAEALESSLMYDILHLTTNKFKKWRQSWPKHLKGVSAKVKIGNEEFKNLLYESPFFRKEVRVMDFLKKGLSAFNEKREKLAIRPMASKYDVAVDEGTIKNYFQKLLEETQEPLKPLLEAIKISFVTQAGIQLKLLEKIKKLELEQKKNLKLIEELINYKNQIESEKDAKEYRRQKRLKRQKRQKPQPFLKEYLPWVLNCIEGKSYSNVTKTRLRLAIVLLVITGVRISEIRFIKVSQIVDLLGKNYLKVTLLKGGHQEHKVFLKKEGQILLNTYRLDFVNLLFLLGFIKKLPTRKNLGNIEPAVLEFYLFSRLSSSGKKPLSRSFFTRQINQILKQTPQLIERGIKLTSHSFRHGYITALWRETNDLEFVRQVMNHQQIGTTSLYVKALSDDERQQRLKNL